MKELIEIIELLQKSKFKTNRLLALVMEPGSQMERLYNAVADDAVQSDEDLIAVFPEWKGSKSRAATLKSKTFDRLLDAILLLDFNESAYADRQKAYFECYKRFTAAIILLDKGARESAVDILEALLRATLRFEFTDLSLEVLRTLSMHYTFVAGEKKKYEEVEAMLMEHEEISFMERRTERLYKDLLNNYVRKKSPKEHLQPRAKEYLDLVQPYMAACNSYRVQLFGRLIELVWHDSLGDYQTVARLAEEGLAFFMAKDYKSLTALQALHYHMYIALLNMREYERCSQLSSQYQDLFKPGSYNWFKLQEVIFLSAMHAGQYEQARAICATTMRHAKFSAQAPPIVELWKIFEAFIAYLISAGRLSEADFPHHFRLSRFNNEVQVFALDKSGMNIPVLVVQFLHHLAKGEQDKCLERVEALAKYRMRYLSEESAFRSHCFIRMLENIPKAGFSVEQVRVRTESIYQSLQSKPLESANQNYEIEVIPYEAAWEMILAGLSMKRIAAA